MPMFFHTYSLSLLALLMALLAAANAQASLQPGEARVWEMQEILLEAQGEYENPYMEVDCWIDLRGPDGERRVYGFWDGGSSYKIRFVATQPGEWSWTIASNQTEDPGLNGGTGTLRAVAWTETEKQANPNRRGFLRATANGRALQYADGTPFFLTGDTWLAGATWRLPWKGETVSEDYTPGPGISFEEAVAYRKRQGYNSVSMVAAFPNWEADHRGATYANQDGVFIRNAWEKFGHWAANATISTSDGAITTAKDMHDEQGNRPFAVFADREGLPDFNRLNPSYFRSLDRKMHHLSRQGFAPFLETVRRDCAPAWKAYFNFDESYSRFVQYLIARYGAYNIIFSGIHLDWIPEKFSLTEHEFNAALTYHRKKYGGLPFGQPYTALIDSSTYKRFGHGEDCPWLTMHTVGNKPRNHAIYASIEEIFLLENPYPAANLEPYYTGWNHEINRPGGETPEANSDRDNYFARSQMYGSFLSGGLAGHVHGTAAYDITTTGEPSGWRPHIWTALKYESGSQMQHLKRFALSEGARYQDLLLASSSLKKRESKFAFDDGLDGWSFMMRTEDRSFALLYFENGAVKTTISGMKPNSTYQWIWYNPRTGEWDSPVKVKSDLQGKLDTPSFPEMEKGVMSDWAAKLVLP
ncbi:DUF5060 domain-containing protein [Pelagicoccus sp. SDUM812003]|uniref:DUF5060 domain-containing protein n=1 Tax=Pelagicoccus sp. SDUM812003 TaxID=3041267 RepID=UPI00280F9C73|nr:DUF5060 domain-containing protein [Pelagicoccus sp. SDUM812003]MDQ8205264.1 DUF5060 domain-containing protein [Pelagicoccus sp. SDUM812003]